MFERFHGPCRLTAHSHPCEFPSVAPLHTQTDPFGKARSAGPYEDGRPLGTNIAGSQLTPQSGEYEYHVTPLSTHVAWTHGTCSGAHGGGDDQSSIRP